MPHRKTPLVNGEIYHIFNRSIAQVPIFNTKRNHDRFLNLIEYYRFSNVPNRYSYFQRQSPSKRIEILNQLYAANKKKIEIFSFSLMPNHFHLLIQQIENQGIREYMKIIQESYAKYFNIIQQRSGSVIQQAFKTVRIVSESHFVHTARYIHLNPLTGYVIKSAEELETYPLTSFIDHISTDPRPFVNTKQLLSLFPSIEKFKQHTFDQLDYQRTLAEIKLHMPGM